MEIELDSNEVEKLFTCCNNIGSALYWLNRDNNKYEKITTKSLMEKCCYKTLIGFHCENIKALPEELLALRNIHLLRIEKGKQLTDISILQYFNKLTYLKLGGCNIRDISFVKYLSGLTGFSLISCQAIEDISPLSTITNIRSLVISDCNLISDLSPLSNLKNLKRLEIFSCNSISDLSPLTNLSNLTTLYLCGCELISDLSPLSNLSNITRLDLECCESLKNITGINNFTNLQSINLSGCPRVHNIEILFECHSLWKIEYNDSLTVCIALAKGAIYRKDIRFITYKKDEWLRELSLTPHPEKLAPDLAKAFNLASHESWAADAFKMLVDAIINTDAINNISEELISTVLCESFTLGDPEFREIFDIMAKPLENRYKKEIANALVNSFAGVPVSARNWAAELSSKILNLSMKKQQS